MKVLWDMRCQVSPISWCWGKGRISWWERETKVWRHSPSLPKEYHQARERRAQWITRESSPKWAVNVRPSPLSLDLQDFGRKRCKSWMVQTQDCIPSCQREWELPHGENVTLTGSDHGAQQSKVGSTQWPLISPQALLPMWTIRFPFSYLESSWPWGRWTNEVCNLVVSRWFDVKESLGKHPINLVSMNCFST